MEFNDDDAGVTISDGGTAQSSIFVKKNLFVFWLSKVIYYSYIWGQKHSIVRSYRKLDKLSG
jgi:hypothetical protein